MKLEANDVKKIAQLAKLSIDESELEDYIADLSNILRLVDKMNEVDTRSIEPLAHPFDISQRLREDKVTEHNQSKVFQDMAPLTEAGLYLVPSVIDSE